MKSVLFTCLTFRSTALICHSKKHVGVCTPAENIQICLHLINVTVTKYWWIKFRPDQYIPLVVVFLNMNTLQVIHYEGVWDCFWCCLYEFVCDWLCLVLCLVSVPFLLLFSGLSSKRDPELNETTWLSNGCNNLGLLSYTIGTCLYEASSGWTIYAVFLFYLFSYSKIYQSSLLNITFQNSSMVTNITVYTVIRLDSTLLYKYGAEYEYSTTILCLSNHFPCTMPCILNLAAYSICFSNRCETEHRATIKMELINANSRKFNLVIVTRSRILRLYIQIPAYEINVFHKTKMDQDLLF